MVKWKPLKQSSFYIFLAIIVGLFSLFLEPFSVTVYQTKIRLNHLTENQKSNLKIAALALNKSIILPKQEFSFNRIVGPRNELRGYQSANTYLGQESIRNFGGGICLLSSALYVGALLINLKITQRIPHTKTINSIRPGLDATVDYQHADLRFINNYAVPLLIHTSVDNEQLKVQFKMKHKLKQAKLKTEIINLPNRKIAVAVFKYYGGKRVVVSQDVYASSL